MYTVTVNYDMWKNRDNIIRLSGVECYYCGG